MVLYVIGGIDMFEMVGSGVLLVVIIIIMGIGMIIFNKED